MKIIAITVIIFIATLLVYFFINVSKRFSKMANNMLEIAKTNSNPEICKYEADKYKKTSLYFALFAIVTVLVGMGLIFFPSILE